MYVGHLTLDVAIDDTRCMPTTPGIVEMAQNSRMIRTGMHLTPVQVNALSAASAATGAPVAELVRRAVEAAYVRPKGSGEAGEGRRPSEYAPAGRATIHDGPPSPR